MEGADLEPELVGHLEGGEHVVGLVAVPLDQDVAAQDERERLQPQVPIRRLVVALVLLLLALLSLDGRRALLARPLFPVARVLLRLGEGLAHGAHVAHPRGGGALLPPVDALRVLAARHLEDRRRAGEPHRARPPLRGEVQHDAAAPDEVPAPGEDSDGRDSAGDRALEGGVLWPERVLGAQASVDRIGELVVVVVGCALGRGGDAHVGVRIDDARGDELVPRVHDDGAGSGNGTVALADGGERAVLEEDEARVESLARRREHGRVLDEDRWGRSPRRGVHGLSSLIFPPREGIGGDGRSGRWLRRRGGWTLVEGGGTPRTPAPRGRRRAGGGENRARRTTDVRKRAYGGAHPTPSRGRARFRSGPSTDRLVSCVPCGRSSSSSRRSPGEPSSGARPSQGSISSPRARAPTTATAVPPRT